MKPPVVEVEWIDACNRSDDAIPVDEAMTRLNLVTRKTVGYLAGQNDSKLVLAKDFDPADNENEKDTLGNFTVIPSGWVKSIKYVTRRPRKPTTSGAAG